VPVGDTSDSLDDGHLACFHKGMSILWGKVTTNRPTEGYSKPGKKRGVIATNADEN